MQVFRSVYGPLGTPSPCVLTIGNFDGLHRGHQGLLERLVVRARALDLPATVMTFEPHPREFFAPEQAPPRLTSLREKLELLAAHGVDRVHVCAFNRRLAALSAEDFIQQILVDGLAVRHLFVGDDFRFGKGRRGDFTLLQQAGRARGFAVEAMQTVIWQGERVSSSYVREVLAAGQLEHAASLLGRPYAISGRVMHGDKIGRQMGFPTANICLKRKSAPLAGVFAVELTGVAGDNARSWPGAASLGTRPTIAAGLKPVLEVHLLDFERDIYGTHVTVNFLHKLRDEARFDSLEELTAHIARDVAAVRDYFQNMKNG
ncbi:MAG: bifunctional riboflavin kinase/FAD synthetase [Sterolibacterium sp.]|nr:bifunctional riboflavin kinase/FAD synthetase [Sterolibacterium sp.]